MPSITRKTGGLPRSSSVNWAAAREAFIARPERPKLADLAAEFGTDPVRLGRVCSDEGWPALRAARLDAALRSSDAVKALLDAARTESTVQRAVSNLALEIVQQLHEVTADAGKATGKAENTRANTLNTVTFALRNLTGALKEVGLVGLPRGLKQAGMADDQGRWNPAMLQALNVTVQNIVGQQPQQPQQGPAAGASGAIGAPVEAAAPLPLAAAAPAIELEPERAPCAADVL
jgi:hypothetical protein